MEQQRIGFTALAAVLSLGVACSSGDDSGDTPFEHPEPTPYNPGTGGDVEASMTPEQVGSMVPDALALGMAFDPAAVLSAYQDLFALAEGDCPEVTSQGDAAYWFGDCTTPSGTTFRGAVRVQLYVDMPEDGATVNGFLLSTEGQPLEITAADGRFMRGAYYMDSRTLDYGDETAYTLYFGGEVSVDGATAAGNEWLIGGMRGTIGRYAGENSGGRYLGISGSFTSAPGGTLQSAGVSAMSFNNLGIVNFGCVGALGTLSLRDGAGAWHDAFFAPEEEPTAEELCDACGALTFQSDTLGDFCSDVTAFENIINWDTTPW